MEKYHAKNLGKVETKPGCWNYVRMGIFDGETQIGEYVRHYPNYGESTFCPFIGQDGNWYALYSEDYTATYVMSLPSCKKVAGQNPSGHGFCPTAFYVPRYRIYVCKGNPESSHPSLREDRCERSYESEGNWNGGTWEEFAQVEKAEDILLWKAGIHYDERGFVSGCVWGDDSSDKIQCLDLSKVHLGILPLAEDFGYVEMAEGLTLKQAVQISDNYEWVTLSVQAKFRMENNKVLKKEK